MNVNYVTKYSGSGRVGGTPILERVPSSRFRRLDKIGQSAPLLLLALLAGGLYSCALPLWEGWDEPMHYGYVQALRAGELPVVGQSTLTKEVTATFQLTPLPKFLSDAVPDSASFAEFAQRSRGERLRRRQELETLTTGLRSEKSGFANYEAQQAPLAYAVLVPIDGALSALHLVDRILVLRLFCSTIAALLTFFALQSLVQAFKLPKSSQPAVMLCALCSQMLWASVCHVGNDWLAIPLTAWFLALLVRVGDGGRKSEAIGFAVVFALGLITKAYFIALAPVFVAILLWRALRKSLGIQTAAAGFAIPLLLAGPWYARNLALYGSISATQESIRGVATRRLMEALISINWLRSFVSFFRSSLWSGNWSFSPFPKGPLNVEMILLSAALILCVLRFRNLSTGLRWALAACACFVAGLVYQTCVAWADSGGSLTTTEPWYSQGVLVFLWVAAFGALARLRVPGRAIAGILCALSVGIAVATFAVFLIPGYSGHMERPTVALAAAWWSAHPTADLRLMALAPPAVVYLLLGLYLATLAIAALIPIRSIFREQ